jgi:hypothetical protein
MDSPECDIRPQILPREKRVKHGHHAIVVVLFLAAAALPAYAYADPSGGGLFQILMPLLAMIWGTWMILANKIRRGMVKLFNRLRGTVEDLPD